MRLLIYLVVLLSFFAICKNNFSIKKGNLAKEGIEMRPFVSQLG